MKIVSGIVAQPKQQFNLTLDDGSIVSMYLEFCSQQLGWFFDIAWGENFLIRGVRLVASPNLLRSYQHIIPFGLGVLTKGNVEPMTLPALNDGTTTVYLLDAADVAAIEVAVFT